MSDDFLLSILKKFTKLKLPVNKFGQNIWGWTIAFVSFCYVISTVGIPWENPDLAAKVFGAVMILFLVKAALLAVCIIYFGPLS